MNTLFILLDGGLAGGKNSSMSWIIMLLIFVVFYVMIMLPQSRRNKQLKKFRESLEVGSKIKTLGGIYGKVSQIKEDGTVLMEIDNNVRIKVDIASVVDASEPTTEKKK